MKAPERECRQRLREIAVRLADANALTDVWWDVVLAVDNEEGIDDLREIVRVASFDKPTNHRDSETVSDIITELGKWA